MSNWQVNLTCVEDGHSKFWRARLQGAYLLVNYGRIGTDGQKLEKTYGSAEEAAADLEKQARGKRKKGYQDAEAPAAAPEPVVVAAPTGPLKVELRMEVDGQPMRVMLEREGQTLRTTVLEQYADESSARAALERIVQAMRQEGYQRVS